ncbi:MAG TPA: glycosyltransferase [Polyangiaceae bacterium]|nr:glycosyltransferase [Polyangiaceae bacterium]
MSAPTSIGLVVPNFNGERFLTATLNSIAEQHYPQLRCIVMDGGSRDASVSIARRFQERHPWLEVVSEKDEGQADAIDKGVRRLDTELVGWLNSDDLLLPGTLHAIADARQRNRGGALFYGDLELCDDSGRLFSIMPALDLNYDTLRRGRGRILQPGSFYTRALLQKAGGVRKEFWGLMDLDLWIRLLEQGEAVRLQRRVAQFRVHPAAKSSEQPLRYYRESLRVAWRYNPDRRVRALLPKLRTVPLHFLRWLFDVHVNAYTPPPLISLPAQIELEGALMPNAVADSLKAAPEFAGAFSATPVATPDIRVLHADTLLGQPRPGRINQSRPRIPVIACASGLSERQASALTALREPLAFVLTTPAAMDRLRCAGFPDFRVGDRTLASDWLRALRVASGELFPSGDNSAGS